MAKELSDIECPECHKQIEGSNRVQHAKWTWGENLKSACEKNAEAKRRIEILTGDKF